MTSDQEVAFKTAGASIKQLRLAAGRSQEDISAESGLDQSNLSKIERIGPHVVSMKKLVQLAECLGCTIEISFRKANDND